LACRTSPHRPRGARLWRWSVIAMVFMLVILQVQRRWK
jgi:hypothetical protein